MKAVIEYLKIKKEIDVPLYIHIMFNLMEELNSIYLEDDRMVREEVLMDVYSYLQDYFQKRASESFKETLIMDGFMLLSEEMEDSGVSIYCRFEE